MKPSPRQSEVMQIIADGSESWGDVWTHYDTLHVGGKFANFDRVCKSLVQRGLVDDSGDAHARNEHERERLELWPPLH